MNCESIKKTIQEKKDHLKNIQKKLEKEIQQYDECKKNEDLTKNTKKSERKTKKSKRKTKTKKEPTNMSQTITLYRLSSSGRLLQWSITMELKGDSYILQKSHGTVGGKITKDADVVVSKGKAGRTIREQTELKFNSLVNKKRDLGYSNNKDGINKDHHLSPMLAQNYEKQKSKIKFPAIAQPKLDGVRCVVQYQNGIVTLKSRKGKQFQNMLPIEKAIKTINLDKNIALDGELFSDVLDFQRLVGIVRKKTMSQKDMDDLKYVKLNVFDCIHLGDKKMTFSARWNIVDEIVKKDKSKVLKIVPIYTIKNEDDINRLLKTFMDNGDEGIMIRNAESPYEIDKRSYHLQKYKKFFDAEYKIVNAEEGTGNDKGTVIWVCELKNGNTFKVRPKGTRGERKKLWKNKERHYGKHLTVKYQELTNDGVPRFPVGIAMRDYE